MTKRIIISGSFFIGLLLILLSGVSAQEQSGFALKRSIPGDIVDFTVDNTGNIYLINRDNQLKKISAEGDSLAVYNAINIYGDIYFVDVTNPLKILIYYRDFLTIVEVDRFLNILNTIDLRSLQIVQVKAIGLAYDNNIWIYDELDAKLKRIGFDGTIVDQTTDFRQLFDSVPDPSTLIDQNGYVYLYDSTKGVYIFDHYGSFKNKVSILGWQNFQVIDKFMIGRAGAYFYKYQLGKMDIEQEAVSSDYMNAGKIRITPDKIYVLKKNLLEIYSKR